MKFVVFEKENMLRKVVHALLKKHKIMAYMIVLNNISFENYRF